MEAVHGFVLLALLMAPVLAAQFSHAALCVKAPPLRLGWLSWIIPALTQRHSGATPKRSFWLWVAALLAFSGLGFAQSNTPNWPGLFNPELIAAIWIALSSYWTISLTEVLKTWFKLAGDQVRLLNGLVNAASGGVVAWILADYVGGLEMLAFVVISAIVGYLIDQGILRRRETDARKVIELEKGGTL